jgi:uncharacterized cupredoxin-like copper-binding protein
MLRLSIALVAVLGAVVAPAALGARSHAHAAAVTVTATEFKFKLSKSSVPHGKVTFTVKNNGAVPHDFKIGGKKTPLISHGKSAKLTVTLKAGKAPYICTVPGHAAAGMKGTLRVT